MLLTQSLSKAFVEAKPRAHANRYVLPYQAEGTECGGYMTFAVNAPTTSLAPRRCLACDNFPPADLQGHFERADAETYPGEKISSAPTPTKVNRTVSTPHGRHLPRRMNALKLLMWSLPCRLRGKKLETTQDLHVTEDFDDDSQRKEVSSARTIAPSAIVLDRWVTDSASCRVDGDEVHIKKTGFGPGIDVKPSR